jgi:hypothetical protein
MFDGNTMSKALRSHNVKLVLETLGKDRLLVPAVAAEFLSAIKLSSALVIQNANQAKEEKRDSLVKQCLVLFEECPDASFLREFHALSDAAKIIEGIYRLIFEKIEKSDAYKFAPAQLAWGTILRAEREFADLQMRGDAALANAAGKKDSAFDPSQMRIELEDGSFIKPDAAINGITKDAGDTLKMLAYLHGWFDKNTGAMILPAEIEVSDQVGLMMGVFSVAAIMWRQVEDDWNNVRLLGGTLSVREEEFESNGKKFKTPFVHVTSNAELELLDHISLNRLVHAYFSRQMEISEPELTELASGFPAVSETERKRDYRSEEEQVAIDVLDGFYHLPVDDESEEIGGLTLRHWIKGYSFLTGMVRQRNQADALRAIRTSEEELVAGLRTTGLTEEQAKKFIGLTTFGRNAQDLFDAPLIKVEGGGYLFFTGPYRSALVGVIALSRISSLNRQRDEEGNAMSEGSFPDKGKHFENRVIQLFCAHGIKAVGFRYKIGNDEYDCDVAALIGETVFIFECKNRSLPLGHLPSLYYFREALQHAKRQVKRNVQHFTDHPEILQKKLGTEAKWQRFVPVVLQALPWSAPPEDGVYFYDGSALMQFVADGEISVNSIGKVGPHKIARRHRYPLRRGNIPTEQEMESVMRDSHQLRLNRVGYERKRRLLPFTREVGLAVEEWSQETSSLEARMIALGSSPEEAAARAKEINSSFPKKISEIWKSAQKKEKIGRNDLCPCGSGEKYKKCCIE